MFYSDCTSRHAGLRVLQRFRDELHSYVLPSITTTELYVHAFWNYSGPMSNSIDGVTDRDFVIELRCIVLLAACYLMAQ